MLNIKINMNNKHIFKGMKPFIAFILFATFQLTAASQVSGFLGKRFVVGLEIPTTLKLGIWNDHHYDYGTYNEYGNLTNIPDYKQVSIKYRPTIRLEYVITRKNSLEGIIRIFNPRVNTPSLTENYTDIYGNISSKNYIPKERVKMKTMSFGLRYKWFSGAAISPIGIYQVIGLEYSRMKFDFEDDSFSWYKRNGPNAGPEYKNPSINTSSIMIVSYGVGKQYALSNTLLMNIGIDFSLPLRLPKTETSLPNNEWADNTGAIAIRHHALFNITLGFGLAL
ncbi:MAG: hypothetical protein ACPGRC_02245 [Salibacteraceae bacterium]